MNKTVIQYTVVVEYQNGKTTFDVEATTPEAAIIEAVKGWKKQKSKWLKGQDITNVYFRKP